MFFLDSIKGCHLVSVGALLIWFEKMYMKQNSPYISFKGRFFHSYFSAPAQFLLLVITLKHKIEAAISVMVIKPFIAEISIFVFLCYYCLIFV